MLLISFKSIITKQIHQYILLL